MLQITQPVHTKAWMTPELDHYTLETISFLSLWGYHPHRFPSTERTKCCHRLCYLHRTLLCDTLIDEENWIKKVKMSFRRQLKFYSINICQLIKKKWVEGLQCKPLLLYDYGTWICCKHSVWTFTSKFHVNIKWCERINNTWISESSHSTHRQAILFPAFSLVRRGNDSRPRIRLTFYVGKVGDHLQLESQRCQ